jgi:LPPG:FO 2-phospho-L-lactate transferase
MVSLVGTGSRGVNRSRFGGAKDQVIVAIAGGVGGAKMAQGLQAILSPSELTVLVNTADDFDLYGLRICPDLDTVMYTLAGIADPVNGWGLAGDTHHTLAAIARYGADPWFSLGDADFATHILRTNWLTSGVPLSEIVQRMSAALGISSRILPMSDDRIATIVGTPDGLLDFQEYFVARRQADDVTSVLFSGIDRAHALPAAVTAVHDAFAVIIAPSNPIVSVRPVLSTPGIGEALGRSTAPVVAVSPIVGGEALKGPAARMLATLGHEVSALGVARLYQGIADGFVIDSVDRNLAPAIEALGTRVLTTGIVMATSEDRPRLASEVLEFASQLAAARA